MSYTGPKKVTYMFIDGGYLRGVLERMSQLYFHGEELTLDYMQLSRGFTKTFYYDCLPPQRKKEELNAYNERCDKLLAHFNQLRSIDGLHVFQGALTGQGSTARQKQVDIQIAVDMLSHCARQNMHELDFIAGDQDFKPLVDALVREGMYVRVWYERSSASRELLNAADARRQIDPWYIHTLQSPLVQARWKLPIRSHERERAAEGAVMLARAVVNNGWVELFKTPEGHFAIVEDDKLNFGQYFSHRHTDLEYLKLLYSSKVGTVDWQIMPQPTA